MAKCWTCGTIRSSASFTCPTCASLIQIRSLQKKVESQTKDILDGLEEGFEDLAQAQKALAQAQFEGFRELRNVLSSGLSEIASAIEWGFGEAIWELQQQTDILRSIDQTLKTPGETQANEWRYMAEELRRRGVYDEAEEFYLKALDLNRLDFRIYVGLAQSYIEWSKFDQAKLYLEKSLPHAPQKDIDYKSFSFRLIGHIYECWEEYENAVAILDNAIQLSPEYVEGHYDYARYCAQLGNVEASLISLKKAISGNPLYWYLAHHEKNFDPIIIDIEKFLEDLKIEASIKARNSFSVAQKILQEAWQFVAEADHFLIKSGEQAILKSRTECEDVEEMLQLAKNKIDSGDYVAFLDAALIVNEAYQGLNTAIITAKNEKEYYITRRSEKAKKDIETLEKEIEKEDIGSFLTFNFIFPLIVGFICGIGGCMHATMGKPAFFSSEGFNTGFLIGFIPMFILFGIGSISSLLKIRKQKRQIQKIIENKLNGDKN